jgi:hypothetical protein
VSWPSAATFSTGVSRQALMDPDPVPDPGPTPDPTPFFNDFKDTKKNVFLFFSYNLPTGTSSSVLKIYFLLKFCVKILFCQALFQSAQDIYEKREGSRAGSASGSAPLTNGSGSACRQANEIPGVELRITVEVKVKEKLPNRDKKLKAKAPVIIKREL